MKKRKKRDANYSLWVLILGVMILLIPYIYFTPDYNELKEKEIIVREVGYVPSKGTDNYYLNTMDGERLEIRGKLSYKTLQETLKPNTLVQIKYYHGLCGLRMVDYIKELTYEGTQLVVYGGDNQTENVIVCSVIGGFMISVYIFVEAKEFREYIIRRKVKSYFKRY